MIVKIDLKTETKTHSTCSMGATAQMNKQHQNNRFKLTEANATGGEVMGFGIVYWQNLRTKIAQLTCRFPNICNASLQRNNRIK